MRDKTRRLPMRVQCCTKSVQCVLSHALDSVKPYTEWCFCISSAFLLKTPPLLHREHHNDRQLGAERRMRALGARLGELIREHTFKRSQSVQGGVRNLASGD